MARRGRRAGGSRRSRDDDFDDDRPRRGGRGRARPSGGGSTGIIIGVVVAVAVLGIGAAVLMGGGSGGSRDRRSRTGDTPQNKRRAGSSKKSTSASTGKSSSPARKSEIETVFAMVDEALAVYAKNDIAGGERKCREIIAQYSNYAGDAYATMSTGLGSPTPANAAEKKGYCQKAIDAYKQPGAKSALYPGQLGLQMKLVALQRLLTSIDRQAANVK